MGLFSKLFGSRPEPTGTYSGQWTLLGGTTPKWRAQGADLYESELIRSAINAIATQCSKLSVVLQGSAKPALRVKLQHAPNEYQTWSQFFYRLATILNVQNSAFIAPVFDDFGQISGIFSLIPSECDIVEYGGTEYLRYHFHREEAAAIELENCGLMTTHQYKNDMFGESNHALRHTAELIDIVNQGIEEGVKTSASYRFMAKSTNWSKDSDLKKERARFSASNFGKEAEAGGLLLFPNTYSDIKQIESKPYVVDAPTMQVIRENVFDYFGVNEAILKNESNGDKWAAFYEGKIEPFAIQFSEVVTKMLYTFREQSQGNRVTATANRIQYMSNADKLQVTQAFADRGLASIDEIREIWNLPPLPDGLGATIPVRGEYYDLATGKEQSNE